jgi:hypothetical protein
VGEVLQLRHDGIVLADVRGPDRALRASWHHGEGIAVISLWRDSVCVGTVRLTPTEVSDLVAALVDGLGVQAEAAAVTAALPALPSA